MQSDVPYSVTSTPFSYRQISGTNLNLGDDTSAQIAVPFPILFGGSSFNVVHVSSNGNLNFSGSFTNFSNEALPTSRLNGALISPFWDDLLPMPGSAGNVFWAATGTTPNRELVIEWRDITAFLCNATESIRFQVVFFEGRADILFNYADATFGGSCTSHDRGASATVSIQVSTALATQYSFNTAGINNGTALLWTYGANPKSWTDDPLTVGLTSLRAVHINELRTRIDALRARFNLSPMLWTDSPIVAGVTKVYGQHLLELRSAVSGSLRSTSGAVGWWLEMLACASREASVCS